MKKLFLCLAAVVLLLSGCGGDTADASVSTEQADEWGVTLSAEDVTPTGMTLVCHQSGGKFKGELMTGNPYILERFVEGEWLSVSVLSEEEVVWTTEGLMIQPNTTTRWKVNWAYIYGYLEPGTYRIAKQITDFRGPGTFTDKTYWAEFSIDEP